MRETWTPKELGVFIVAEVKPPRCCLEKRMDAMPITETERRKREVANVKSILDQRCSAWVGLSKQMCSSLPRNTWLRVIFSVVS